MVANVGQFLKEKRELKGMSLAELARATRIPQHTLKAIEEGRFDDLPGEVFVRGFLKSYAVAVGVPSEEALARFTAGRRNVAITQLPPSSSVERVGDSGRKFGVAIAFVVLLILFTLAVSIMLKPRGRDFPTDLSSLTVETPFFG